MSKIRVVVFLSLIAGCLSCRQSSHQELYFTHVHDPMAGPQGKANMDWVNDHVALFQQLYPQWPIKLQQVLTKKRR